MLRGRIADACVHLCFVCVIALAVNGAPRKACSHQTIRNVQSLIGKASGLLWLDCRLYTPTMEDYKNCPSATLRCFSEEMKVLLSEWRSAGTPHSFEFTLTRDLSKLAKLLKKTDSECLQCERLQERNAGHFLSVLNSTLLRMNFEHC